MPRDNHPTAWRCLGAVALLLLIPSAALAETFCIQSIDSDPETIDAGSQRTFMTLLRSEVRSDGAMLETTMPEDAASCDTMVDVTIGRLGQRIFVGLEWDGMSSGSTQSTAASVEELDTVAARLATTLVTGRDGEMSNQLGEITQDVASVDNRIGLESGAMIRLGAHIPVGQAFNDASAGPAIELGYWGEARKFALEARTGARWATNRDSDDLGSMFMWNVDLGGVWLPALGNVSPMLGGGVGLRYASAPRVETEVSGDIIVVVQEQRLTDSSFGMGTWVRAGVFLLRTYDVRISLHADFELNVMKMGDQSVHPGVMTALSMYF
jgi:hypothetical protein